MDTVIWSAPDLALHLSAQYSWQARGLCVCGCALASALYLKLVVARHVPSLYSLLLVAPVVALNFWAPLLFPVDPEIIPRTVATFVLMWLGTFKTIGFCLGRGPLGVKDWNLLQFICLYITPLYPRQDFGSSKAKRAVDTSSKHLFLQFLANTTILCIVAFLLAAFELPRHVKHYIYALGLYGFVSFMMEGPAVLMVGLLGLQVTPVFDKPWLATSLAEFWSQRWNNNTSLMLRALVYEPMMEGRLLRKAKQGGPVPAVRASRPLAWKLAGMCATFAVSGIMHEIILLYVCRPYIPGLWFTFFFIQAPLIIAEIQVLKHFKARSIDMPWLLRLCATVSVLLFTSDLFFFPPVDEHSDTADRVVHAVLLDARLFQEWLAGWASPLLGRH